ncbi:hypothetical protein BJX64DRAFT_94549 [Aspergillus heterothallicus]
MPSECPFTAFALALRSRYCSTTVPISSPSQHRRPTDQRALRGAGIPRPKTSTAKKKRGLCRTDVDLFSFLFRGCEGTPVTVKQGHPRSVTQGQAGTVSRSSPRRPATVADLSRREHEPPTLSIDKPGRSVKNSGTAFSSPCHSMLHLDGGYPGHSTFNHFPARGHTGKAIRGKVD